MFWDLSRYWKPYWFHTLPIRSHKKITQKILNFQFFPMRSRNLKVPKIREFEMYMGPSAIVLNSPELQAVWEIYWKQNIDSAVWLPNKNSLVWDLHGEKVWEELYGYRLSQIIKPFDSHIWELLFLPTTIVYYIFIYYKFLFIIECYFIFILYLLYIIL